MKFRHVAIGGTFDHLHKGHKSILAYSLEVSQKVSIGITTDQMLRNKSFSNSIESYRKRRQGVIDYLQSLNLLARAKLFELKDIYGIASTDKTLQAIIVTKETHQNASKINILRKKNNLKPLNIVEVPLIKDSHSKIIRSTRIRNGEINRSGYIYGELFDKHKNLQMPESLKELLRRPIGQVIHTQEKDFVKTGKELLKKLKQYNGPLVVTVGDVVTLSLLMNDFVPNISIVDLVNKREKINLKYQKILVNKFNETYINKPSTITRRISLRINRIYKNILKNKQKKSILIRGEEDLLALPVIVFAPLGAIVVYGQIGIGLIYVVVTEKIKENVREILKQFK